MRRSIRNSRSRLALSLLARTGGLLALAGGLHAQAAEAPIYWRGEVVYFADSASFTDCATGQRWPVMMTGDFLALQRSYLAWRSEPAAPLLMSFEGRTEMAAAMEGPPREQMVVSRFSSAQPGMDCASIGQKARVGPAP